MRIRVFEYQVPKRQSEIVPLNFRRETEESGAIYHVKVTIEW